MRRGLDLVVFGATGFTGGLVVDYIAGSYGKSGLRAKLEKVVERLRDQHGDAGGVAMEVVDAGDKEALAALAAKTRVVLTTVGPFALYGTNLVEACAEAGTHYVDSTGESVWVRAMIDAFDERAKRSGARILSCCGFDSIPSDLGTLMLADFARREYGRYLGSVRSFVSSNGTFSGGTLASAFTMIETGAAREASNPYLLNPGRTPAAAPTDADADVLFPAYSRDARAWTVPWVMAAVNTRVVRRSHALLRNQESDFGPAFHYNEVMRVPSFLVAVFTWLGLGLALVAIQFSFVRSVARRFLPAPGQGPSAERRQRSWFKMKLVGEVGEQRGTAAPNAKEAPRTVVGMVMGGDPGYTETAKMLAETALAIALEEDRLPKAAGHLTTAAGVGLPLIERLRAAGLIFEAKAGPQRP